MSALDICWDLRLKVDLAVYLRAKVNLMIGLLATKDQLKFARESLDLFDLLLEEHTDEENIAEQVQHIAGLQDNARKLIARCQNYTQTKVQEPASPTAVVSNRLSDIALGEKRQWVVSSEK